MSKVKRKKKIVKRSVVDKWWFWVGILLAILLVIIGLNMTGVLKGQGKVKPDTMVETTLKTDTFRDDAYNVTTVSYKIISPGEEGNTKGENPVIAFWYDTSVPASTPSNDTTNPLQAWADNYTVTQGKNAESGEKLQLVSTPVKHFIDSQVKKIEPGHKYQNAVAYELVDSSNSVFVTHTAPGSHEKVSEEFRIK